MLNGLTEKLRIRSMPAAGAVGIVALITLILIAFNGGVGPPDGQAVSGFGSQSMAVLSILAFIGGVVSFVSPRTLPILPAYFAFTTQGDWSRIAVNTVAFMLGVSLMFSLLGAGASALGRFIIQHQQSLLLVGGAIVMVFGAMSLLRKGSTSVSSDGSPSLDDTFLSDTLPSTSNL